MASRGIVYVVWGENFEDELERSIESASFLNLPHHVIHLEDGLCLADKAKMYQMTPFDETLFLDTDTIVLGDLSYGFQMSRQFGVAIAIAPACYASRGIENCHKDLIEYNTGVMFFVKNESTRSLFDTWFELSSLYPNNDQLSFALAVNNELFNPFVLQPNWNYRAHLMKDFFFGPIKIWHSRMPLPVNVNEWNLNAELKFGKIVATEKYSFLKMRKISTGNNHIEELFT